MKTINHNRLWTLSLLAVIPLAAQAQAPASATIAMECQHRYISQVDAARVMGTDNFSQTYAKRQSLYANVARACQRGVREVLVVVEVPAQTQRALASK